jgi:hypothetical protein
MSYLRNLWRTYRRRPQARPEGYDAEVLFAGWVSLPPAFHDSRK